MTPFVDFSPKDLEEIYSKYSAEVESTDVSNLVTTVQVEFDKYKEAVSNFFTGKADDIKFIYKSIRERSFPYNKIITSDSNKARHLYLEYYEGLKEYISKLMDIKSTDEIDKDGLMMIITQVKQRDHEFIDSIYSEEKNPPEEMDLSSAMMNIEVLIDIYNNADLMIDDLKKFVLQLGNVDFAYTAQVVSGLKLMAHSIRHFHKDMIKEILECYEKIHASIQNRTPVTGEKVVETYQLF